MSYTKKDYESDNGMLTSVWGPPMWHFLHTMSFNYPVKPTDKDKHIYMNFIKNLGDILPCKYCRENFKKNMKEHPINIEDMKNRKTFSMYIYKLHNVINTMLGKENKLSYNEVRMIYEHFRSRCNKTVKRCITPKKGIKKTKCVINIVPFNSKTKTFNISKKCNN